VAFDPSKNELRATPDKSAGSRRCLSSRKWEPSIVRRDTGISGYREPERSSHAPVPHHDRMPGHVGGARASRLVVVPRTAPRFKWLISAQRAKAFAAFDVDDAPASRPKTLRGATASVTGSK